MEITQYCRVANLQKLFDAPYEPAELKQFHPSQILKLMQKLTHSWMGNWDEVHAIPGARTPILKLYQHVSGCSVDISFSSRYGVHEFIN